ncbi:MAG: hypothetical protein ACRELY_21935 [Polyangiaceae bacterium]
MSRVLLACASDWQAPARLPKIFRRAGLEVHAFCPRDAGIVHTKYVDRAHEAPADIAAFADALAHYLTENEGVYEKVIAIDDPLLAHLTHRRSEAWTADLLPIDRESRFAEIVASKAALVGWASDLALRIPPSRVVRTKEEAAHAMRSLGFPAILKVDCSFAGMGVALVESSNDIARAWDAIRPTGAVVVQAFIRGELGNTAVLYSKGSPVAWMSAFKSRTWPGPFGPSCARKFVDHEDLAPMIARFGAETGYDGFVAFDWIVDGCDRAWILEVNARPVPALHMGAYAGVDFADAIARWLSPGARHARPAMRSIANPAIFPMFPEDFHRAITDADDAGLDAFRKGNAGYDDIPWDDPPLLAHLLRRRSTKRAFDRILGTIEDHATERSAAVRARKRDRLREL